VNPGADGYSRITPNQQEFDMFAVIAAILFAIAFLLNVFHGHLGDITITEWMLAGLFFFALHFAYTGGGWRRARR
jgi:hypothetical protein